MSVAGWRKQKTRAWAESVASEHKKCVEGAFYGVNGIKTGERMCVTKKMRCVWRLNGLARGCANKNKKRVACLGGLACGCGELNAGAQKAWRK